MWLSLWHELQTALHMVQLMPLHPKTLSPLASFKSRLVLPFWYRLTQVVLEKRPLNGCSVLAAVLVVITTQDIKFTSTPVNVYIIPDAMHPRYMPWPCVCLSQVGVLLKRLNVGSHKQNHTIAQGI